MEDLGDAENVNEIEVEIEELKDVQHTEDSIFKTFTIDEIEEEMHQLIVYVGDCVKPMVSMMNDSDIRALLIYMKWDQDQLLLNLTGENRDEFISNTSVPIPFERDEDPLQKRPKNTCVRCLWDTDQKDSIRLRCGHECCTDCCREYLTAKIVDDNATESILCPAENCDKIIDSDCIMHVITDADARQKYKYLVANSFVQHNHVMRWCPAPDCSLAIQINSSLRMDYVQNCTCTCGEQFCFDCGDECHDPLPCYLFSKWKMDRLCATALDVKKCPNPDCVVRFEKDGGCNYMQCTLCEHEFCWTCCGDWDNFNPELHDNCLQGGAENGNIHLMHYKSNETSLECEQMLMESDAIKNPNRKLMYNSNAYLNLNVMFLANAVKILCESRKLLMWSYIFAYFVKPHPQKEIFALNQEYLQSIVEKLSTCLKQNLNEMNTDTVNEMKNNVRLCGRLRSTLKEHIYEGIDNNWWSYECYW